jgi:copper chaperone CopZ
MKSADGNFVKTNTHPANGSSYVTLKIKGMMCEKCVAHVKEALESVDGVVSADVSLGKKRAVATIDGYVNTDKMVEAVTKAGYSANTNRQ